jgi:GH25 family lysozyme M1 (1,4-beta-N-acetylmuramidase)
MKKFLFAFLFTAICTLTACGEVVGTNSEGESSVDTAETTAVSQSAETTETIEKSAETTTQTSTATTVATTETTTTTVKIEDKVIPKEVYFETLDTVEVYDEVPLSELITDTNVTLLEPDKIIGTKKLGRVGVKVRFEYEGEEYLGKVGYDVVDTTAPVVLNSGWNPYVKLDQPFNLSSLVGYVDNFDRSLDLSYTGEVDTSTIGRYDITATVTDDSGNSTSWDMAVYVLMDIPAPEDNNPRVNFTDFVDYYCYENVSYGIDVSAWQTNVDYEKVKAQGCEFVIMRMGYFYGDIVMDDYYQQNMENATNAGLDVGVYFYTTANTEDEAREQARWIVEQLDGRELDYPVAFDWEEWGQFQQYGMNVRDLNEIFEAFCDELEKNGYTGMLYSSKNFLNNFWTNKNNRPVWLAHYVDETDYDGQFAIWQASAYGRMDGIEGDVDMNIRINDVPLG